MPPSGDSQLRDLLRKQAKRLSEEAIRPGGQLPPEQLESLERLARLTEIVRGTLTAPRKRWPIVAAFGITLATVSILLFARVAQTEIDADVMVSGVSFEIPAPQVLLDATQAVSLGASGLREIHLPQTGDRPGRILRGSPGSESVVRFAVAHSGKRSGTITLDPLAVPAGTRAWLRTTEVPNQVRLSLRGEGLAFRVNLSGSVALAVSREPAGQFDFSVPVPVVLRAGAEEIDLDIEFGAVPLALPSQLSVRNLSFLHTEQFTDDRRTIIRNRSTILAGTLFFESLGDRARTLRPGEVIRFTEARGDIRTLRWHNSQLALRFHGTVGGMRSGPGEHAKSLMPTWLEWLQARHGLALLWAATLYTFGFVFGALRWWRHDI